MDIQANQSSGGVFPIFRIRAVPNKPKSLEAGRPIYEDVEWVDIHIAGDNKTVVSKKVTAEHRQRWPEHYSQFKAGIENPIVGTPLEQWPVLPASKVAELKALNIRTVEDLSALTDAQIQNIGMGGRELVAQATAFIDAAKDSAGLEKLAAENSRLRDELEMLKEQIQALGEKPESPTPLQPGRLLPARAAKAMEKAGIRYEDLPNMTKAEFLDKTEGVGEKTLQDVINVMALGGLAFRAE